MRILPMPNERGAKVGIGRPRKLARRRRLDDFPEETQIDENIRVGRIAGR